LLGFIKRYWLAPLPWEVSESAYIFVSSLDDVYFFGLRDTDFWIGSRNRFLTSMSRLNVDSAKRRNGALIERRGAPVKFALRTQPPDGMWLALLFARQTRKTDFSKPAEMI
jgi:hypothetical protein